MATNLYETDFVAWTKEQAAELRRLRDARINTRLEHFHADRTYPAFSM